MSKAVSQQLLISYVGKFPFEIDLALAFRRKNAEAKRKKLKPVVEESVIEEASTLTLRPNTTSIVSEAELAAVKDLFGDLSFKRYIVEHGEHKPRDRSVKLERDETSPVKSKAMAKRKVNKPSTSVVTEKPE